MSIPPLANTNRKGRTFPIMLQHFRRTIGVAVVGGNGHHKLGRLYYVRGTT